MRVSIDDAAGKPPLRVGMSTVVDVDTGRARGLPDFVSSFWAAPAARIMSNVASSPATPVANRGAITACVILAVIMQALDTTIANVALPYIQGSVSASADQINWVLTSYIVAAAIMTPPSGFLAAKFGRKRVLLAAIVGFVVASVLCGLAQSLSTRSSPSDFSRASSARLWFPSPRASSSTSIASRSAARPWPYLASRSWSGRSSDP